MSKVKLTPTCTPGLLRHGPEDGVQFLGSMCKRLLQRHGFSVSYDEFFLDLMLLHYLLTLRTLRSRNIKGFMIQGGDPTGTGKGGESIWGGKFQDEFHPDNTHDKRGQVSMVSSSFCCRCCAVITWPHAWVQANTGTNTNGSQFFITYERQPHLNNVYTVFAKVIDGWDVLDQFERLPVEGAAAAKKRNKTRPINPPVIRSVTIHANPLADNNIIYPTKDGPVQ